MRARSPARAHRADGGRRTTRARRADEEIIAGWSTSDDDDDGATRRRRGVRRRGRGGRGRARIARVGGVEVVVDRVGGATATTARGAAAERARDDDAGDAEDSETEDSDEAWSDGSSVDDDAAMDYAENCSRGDALARELRAIANMNVEGGPPERRRDSSDDEEIEARFAANASDDVDDDGGDAKWSRVVAAAIDAGAAYVGCPTSLSLEDAARVARRHDCALEVRGGGKRRHAIIHIDSASRREPRASNVREARASTKSTRGAPAKKARRRTKPAVQFISGGVARDLDVFIDDDEEEEDPRKKSSTEPAVSGEPVVYPNRGARRAAEAQARDREFIEKARAKKRGTVVGAGHEYGAFEKHTTGFGSRMLAKMGFQGQGSGVGREGEGIAEPVVATTRGKRVGLGAFGAER